MGFLDLPAPLLSWADRLLARAAPESARILVWAIAAAVASMLLYWALSPQRRLARLAAEERMLRERLSDASAEMADGLGSAGRLLRLALLRLGLVLLPACVAALPVICIMVWMQAHYAYEMPAANAEMPVRVEPKAAEGRVVAGNPVRVEVRNGQGALIQSVPLGAPVPVVHKRVWWNALVGNPLGYLPDNAAIDRIEIDLPEKHYLPVGPDWMRRWESLFIAALLAGSLAIKLAFRIR